MKKFVCLFGIIFLCVFTAAAQGGKAEPLRIEIPGGRTSISVTGTLKEGEQMEYVFNARKEQLAFIWINSIKPTGKFYSFIVKGAENNFVSDMPRLEVEKFPVPETGDYLIFVKFRSIGKIKQGSYKLTLEIKN